MKRAAILLLLALTSTSAFAQARPAAPPPQDPATRRTIIDMDADVIEASPLGPNDHVLATRVHHRFKSLIQTRTSFSKELLATALQMPAAK